MNEKFLIAIDSGKYATKATGKFKDKIYTTSFRTKVQQISRLGVDVQPNSYYIQYQGSEYLLGQMVSEEYCNFSLTKTSLIHQLSIYNAIAQLLKKANAPSNVDIRLAVNVPITTYKDSIQKEQFKERIENQKRIIHIFVNEKAVSFGLQDVTVCFEGMGEIFARPDEYRNKSSIVIDIGGLNCTLCQFSGINPLVNSMVVSDLGINILKGKLGKAINERYGVSVSSDDLEQVIRNGYFANRGEIFEDSKVFIEELKWEHLQQIIQFAQSRRYTFNNADIHFVGGGAIMLNRYIKSEFPSAQIMTNPQFSNCLSFLKILEVKYA